MTKPNGQPTPAEAEVLAIYAQVRKELAETVEMMERHIGVINEMIGRVERAHPTLPKPRKRKRGP